MLPPALAQFAAWPPGPALALALWVLAAVAAVLVFQRVLTTHARRTSSTLDDAVLAALRLPLFLGLLLGGAWALVTSFGLLSPEAQPTARLAVIAGLVLLGAHALARLGSLVVRHAAQKKPGFRAIEGTLTFGLRFLLYATALMLILHHAGITITPLLGALGIGGLAVALALQDTLANFFAGMYLRLDRPMREGDFVELEGGLVRGWVREVGWRSVRVREPTGSVVTLPNSRVVTGVVRTNQRGPQVSLAVAYDSDLEEVEQLALDTAHGVLARFDGEKPSLQPLVRFTGFIDQGVAFTVALPSARDADQALLAHLYVKALHARLVAAGITFRFLPGMVSKLAPPPPPPPQAARRT